MGSDSQSTNRVSPGVHQENAQSTVLCGGESGEGPIQGGSGQGLSRKASWRRQPSLVLKELGRVLEGTWGARSRLPGQREPLIFSSHTHTPHPYLNLSGVLLIDYKLDERQTLLPKALMVHLVAHSPAVSNYD